MICLLEITTEITEMIEIETEIEVQIGTEMVLEVKRETVTMEGTTEIRDKIKITEITDIKLTEIVLMIATIDLMDMMIAEETDNITTTETDNMIITETMNREMITETTEATSILTEMIQEQVIRTDPSPGPMTMSARVTECLKRRQKILIID